MLISFLFLDENICCGYSLEVPRWGASNEYPQQWTMFSSRNKKNIMWIPPLICSYVLKKLTICYNFAWLLKGYCEWLNVTLSMLGNNFSRWDFEIFFWFFLENRKKRGYPHNIFLISRRKHMLWVLIRGASNEYPQRMFSLRNKKDNSIFRMKKVPYLLLWGLTHHANCLPIRRQFAWNIISYFLGKIRKLSSVWHLLNLPIASCKY